MILLGYLASYDGEFGDASVVQCGRWKVIPIREYDNIPIKLKALLFLGEITGAQFLVIDPEAVDTEKAEFIDVPVGQMLAA